MRYTRIGLVIRHKLIRNRTSFSSPYWGNVESYQHESTRKEFFSCCTIELLAQELGHVCEIHVSDVTCTVNSSRVFFIFLQKCGTSEKSRNLDTNASLSPSAGGKHSDLTYKIVKIVNHSCCPILQTLRDLLFVLRGGGGEECAVYFLHVGKNRHALD